MSIKTNTTSLQEVLEKVNALPTGGGDGGNTSDIFPYAITIDSNVEPNWNYWWDNQNSILYICIYDHNGVDFQVSSVYVGESELLSSEYSSNHLTNTPVRILAIGNITANISITLDWTDSPV